jgi:hypothetical protein
MSSSRSQIIGTYLTPLRVAATRSVCDTPKRIQVGYGVKLTFIALVIYRKWNSRMYNASSSFMDQNQCQVHLLSVLW